MCNTLIRITYGSFIRQQFFTQVKWTNNKIKIAELFQGAPSGLWYNDNNSQYKPKFKNEINI